MSTTTRVRIQQKTDFQRVIAILTRSGSEIERAVFSLRSDGFVMSTKFRDGQEFLHVKAFCKPDREITGYWDFDVDIMKLLHMLKKCSQAEFLDLKWTKEGIYAEYSNEQTQFHYSVLLDHRQPNT